MQLVFNDLTYSFNPAGRCTATHQMTVNGKRDNFSLADFNTCARTTGMKRGRAKAILGEVIETVSRWQEFANEAGVPPTWHTQIQKTLRLTGF